MRATSLQSFSANSWHNRRYIAFSSRFALHWYGLARLGTDWSQYARTATWPCARRAHQTTPKGFQAARKNWFSIGFASKSDIYLSSSSQGVLLLRSSWSSRQQTPKRIPSLRETKSKHKAEGVAWRRALRPSSHLDPSWIPPWIPLRVRSHISKKAASRDKKFQESVLQGMRQ